MAAHTAEHKSRDLFGGDDNPWDASKWTASDDRVRGGQSTSHLEVSTAGTARFYGHLDTTTLGGAGFASQRTTGTWDLSDYVAVRLHVKKGDKKRYTLILKDKLLPANPDNGREQATISWEADFELPPTTIPGDTHDRTVIIPFASLNPTYRGKLQKDAAPLDTKKIQQISLMMRSFFGTQHGDFSLEITSITALPTIPKQGADPGSGVDARQLEDGKTGQGVYDGHAADLFGRLMIRLRKHAAAVLAVVAGLAVTYQLMRWFWV
ncbi:hypothetical protein LTR53_016475 [Teratosphaeriaceae sp. CCFEE 6253]|nr:hypothetical protein LTR53_016475 [Teratosphaeriaceae sp. CCFEE 6253]